MDGLDRRGDRGMELQPLARQQLVVHRLANEAVAELHDLIGAGQQQVAVDCFPQRSRQIGRLHPGDDRQDVVARGLAGDGDHAEEVPRCGREATDPSQQRLPEREPKALLSPLLHGEQLLGEERVAAAALVEAGDEGTIGRTAEDARELVADLARGERGELDALHLPAAAELGEEAEEQMALVQLVRAIGAEQHDAPVRQVAHQEPQHVAGRLVRPVQVLERDDGDHVRGDALDQAEHLEVEDGLGGGGGCVASGLALAAEPEVGDEVPDGRSRRTDDAVELVGGQGPQPRPERSDERVVGPRTIAEVDTPTLEEAHPGGLGAPSKLREQPGLADAGLAPDDDRADRPRPGAVQRSLQPPQLLAASDEHGTRDPHGHRPIMRDVSIRAPAMEGGLRTCPGRSLRSTPLRCLAPATTLPRNARGWRTMTDASSLPGTGRLHGPGRAGVLDVDPDDRHPGCAS